MIPHFVFGVTYCPDYTQIYEAIIYPIPDHNFFLCVGQRCDQGICGHVSIRSIC